MEDSHTIVSQPGVCLAAGRCLSHLTAPCHTVPHFPALGRTSPNHATPPCHTLPCTPPATLPLCCHCFPVFDGHGGDAASIYSSEHLPDALLQSWTGTSDGKFSAEGAAEALSAAFVSINDNFLSSAWQTGGWSWVGLGRTGRGGIGYREVGLG